MVAYDHFVDGLCGLGSQISGISLGELLVGDMGICWSSNPVGLVGCYPIPQNSGLKAFNWTHIPRVLVCRDWPRLFDWNWPGRLVHYALLGFVIPIF